MNTKICSNCKIEKPFSEYHKDSKNKIGIRYECRDCSKIIHKRSYDPIYQRNYTKRQKEENPEKLKRKQKNDNLKKCYGITLEQYELLLSQQNYRCAICFKTPEKTLHVDHCHKTGKIRGLLCHNCNTAIGLLFEDELIIKSVLEYLIR